MHTFAPSWMHLLHALLLPVSKRICLTLAQTPRQANSTVWVIRSPEIQVWKDFSGLQCQAGKVSMVSC